MKPKELRIQLEHGDNAATVRIFADNTVLGSMTLSAGGAVDILRMKIKKGWTLPFVLESFEVNAGIWKGTFKRAE